MRKSKSLIILTVVMVLALGVAMVYGGCGESGGGGGGEIQQGGTFYYCLNAEPVSLDPAQLQESEGIAVGKALYDGLMDNDPETMEITPAMADSYEVNDDATVFTFNLKKGVMFHNGRECTADDFVYSWNRVVDPATASEVAYHLSPVKGYDEFQAGTATSLEGVEALDDYTFQVTLSYPYADFVYHTAHPALSPIPEEVVEEFGSENFSENPVGTGPFSFESWTHEQQVVTNRFEDYYGQAAYLDSVVYKIYMEEETAYQDFKAGTLNECQIPQGQFESAVADFGDQAIFNPMLGIYYYGMNMTAAPWKDNQALRQAMNYAVDRQTLCDVVMEGQRIPATGFVPMGIPGYQSNAMPYKYDKAEAEKLLTEAGFPGGQGLPALTLGYNTGGGHEDPAQFIQGNLKDVGVNVTIEGYEWGSYLDLIQAAEVTFFRMGWLTDYPIMDNFLYPLFYSTSTDNFTMYNNPEIDKMLDQARSTPDQEARFQLYQETERMVLEEAPVIPLMFYKTSRVYGDGIGGYIRTADDLTPMERVYFTTPQS
jgi:peptide/nickel transport system substrate-binding protein/oligopeptide transport system substrate-binding protein